MTAPRKQFPEVVADEILVQRAVQGDVAAFEVLIRRHGPLMRAYVTRIVGSLTEADDVVQEAFYIAWRRLPELRDPHAVKSWLMQVASRQAFRHLRRRPAEDPLPVLEAAHPADTQPENVAIRNAQLCALATALDTLAPDLRQAWLLREIAELSYDDIAKQLDIPRTTVRGKLSRARASLYAQMEEWR